MRGGNYEIGIEGVDKEIVIPELPFLCTHNQYGTYCGIGLVIKDNSGTGENYTLVDLGDKKNGGFFNTVFTRDNLPDLMSIANIIPRSGKIIIYKGEKS